MRPDPSTNSITVACPAKLNLALAVGPADPERQGYHPIASWMVALNFADRLTLRTTIGPDSEFQIAFANEAPAEQPLDWPLEHDLAYRAHAQLEQVVGRRLPIRLRLDKRIPAGAGLAGGSSNAAATLVAVNRLFDLGIPGERLIELAAELGCDCAFLTAVAAGDTPSALVTGIGHTLESLPLTAPIHIAFVLPPFTCPTGGVYRQFDQLPGRRPFRRRAERVDELARRGSPLSPTDPMNDLQPAAVTAQPQLGELLAILRDDLELPAHVTGSGSAVFVIADSADHAQAIASAIERRTGYPAIATQTLTT